MYRLGFEPGLGQTNVERDLKSGMCDSSVKNDRVTTT
jgi:hypothetical protein